MSDPVASLKNSPSTVIAEINTVVLRDLIQDRTAESDPNEHPENSHPYLKHL
jgi:hypothetical protein